MKRVRSEADVEGMLFVANHATRIMERAECSRFGGDIYAEIPGDDALFLWALAPTKSRALRELRGVVVSWLWKHWERGEVPA